MIETTIWDFLPQESSTEAKSTNQRNIIMEFNSLEELLAFLKNPPKSDSMGAEPTTSDEAEELDHNSEDCTDCKLASLNPLESLLTANVNVSILEVIQNTLNQEAPIRNEQADTLLKLAQVKSILGSC